MPPFWIGIMLVAARRSPRPCPAPTGPGLGFAIDLKEAEKVAVEKDKG